MKRKFSPSIVDRVRHLAATASILILVAVLSNCGGKSQPPPPALTMGPSSLPNLDVGVPNISPPIFANGGVAPYNWSVSAGSLPHNLSLVPSGSTATLSGTADQAAQGVNFTIQVTDSARQSASQAYTVAVLLTAIS